MKKKNEEIEIEDVDLSDIQPKNNFIKDNPPVKNIIKNSMTDMIEGISDLNQSDLKKIQSIIKKNKKSKNININPEINTFAQLEKEYKKIKKDKNSKSINLLIDNDLQDLCLSMSKEMNISRSQLTNMSYILLYSFLKKTNKLK